MIQSSSYFKFYASCIPVKGIKRGAIYDLRRESIFLVPLSILEIMAEYSDKTVLYLFNDYSEQYETLKKYFDFLLENELIFFTDSPHQFPELSRDFHKPFEVNTILMEIDNFDVFKRKLVVNKTAELNTIGCSELVLISKTDCFESLGSILEMLETSKVKSVTYFIDHQNYVSDNLRIKSETYLRLREIIVYNCPKTLPKNTIGNVSYSSLDLGMILGNKISGMDDFILDRDAFSESKDHNLFFNRRVYIDNDNNVKLSIENSNIYGNLSQQNLRQIIKNKDLQEVWNTSNDMVEVCKDCEFRYICSDPAIPIKKDGEQYYHKNVQCNYNPYLNLWKKK